jgi:hypothetical protein
VGRASPFTGSYLREAHPVSLGKNLLTIGFDPEFAEHLELVDNLKNRTLIQTKLGELGMGGAQVRFVKAEPYPGRLRPQPPAAPSPGQSATSGSGSAAPKPTEQRPGEPSRTKLESVPFNQEDFKEDPLIQKALEVFKGQIVEVRA